LEALGGVMASQAMEEVEQRGNLTKMAQFIDQNIFINKRDFYKIN
jgi:hypothetical protein